MKRGQKTSMFLSELPYKFLCDPPHALLLPLGKHRGFSKEWWGSRGWQSHRCPNGSRGFCVNLLELPSLSTTNWVAYTTEICLPVWEARGFCPKFGKSEYLLRTASRAQSSDSRLVEACSSSCMGTCVSFYEDTRPTGLEAHPTHLLTTFATTAPFSNEIMFWGTGA